MKNILQEIVDYKKKEITDSKKSLPEIEIINFLKENGQTKNFFKSLIDKNNKDLPGIIAEIKKASPSKGELRKNFNPANIAEEYEKGGAACLSILTDFPSFQGKLSHIKTVKDVSFLPIIRKDFIIDPYQIYESKFYGADCILIIMKIVDKIQAKELKMLAEELDLDVLIEIQSEEEVEKALYLDPKMIGINNRNLKNFSTDIENSIKITKLIPKGILVISESGISNSKHINLLMDSGIKNFLIGESLMRSDNISNKLESLIKGSTR
ncbi:MAG: indole-3-glycerol phosphate synthase TrpC [Pseudomonadota bacterium]|nr:indole-3-glycerol phosphate synthase TrpC [Pseudomonadota bacterium]MEE3294931.1 indole-3-glycerol phosphate synthase TrpC [Pseudomonadota bacterium]